LHSKLKHGTLANFVCDFDIICLIETLTDSVAESDFPDHDIFVLSGLDKNTLGGFRGICVLVKKGFVGTCVPLGSLQSKNVLWLKFKSPAGDVWVLGAVYLPHIKSVFYSIEQVPALADDIANILVDTNVKIILAGILTRVRVTMIT